MTRMDDATIQDIEAGILNRKRIDDGPFEHIVKYALQGYSTEVRTIIREARRARAEEVRLRAALDAIGEGHAGSHYSALQEYARAALAGEPSS